MCLFICVLVHTQWVQQQSATGNCNWASELRYEHLQPRRHSAGFNKLNALAQSTAYERMLQARIWQTGTHTVPCSSTWLSVIAHLVAACRCHSTRLNLLAKLGSFRPVTLCYARFFWWSNGYDIPVTTRFGCCCWLRDVVCGWLGLSALTCDHTTIRYVCTAKALKWYVWTES